MSTSHAANDAPALNSREAGLRAREILFNVGLSLFFLQFAIVHGAYALETLRLSTILLFIKISTDVVFYLSRRIPKAVSLSVYDWFIGIAGTWFVLFLRPVSGEVDTIAGQGLQLAGVALQIAAMLSLNRSIGMVAANRGIQTKGLYALVRHPLYLSYVIAFLGYLINHFSIFNTFIFAVAVALWILRLRTEEAFLMKSGDYQTYAARVRWRMVPGLY